MSENMKTAREVAEDVQGELINGLANLLYDGDGPAESDEQTNDRYAAWLERIWQGEPVRHHALGDAVKRISDAEAERDLLMAATWDVYCALGYDPDGDNRWHCSPEVAARTVVQCAKEAREFSEEVGDECEEQRERAERAEAERDRYAEREAAFSRGLRVADAGRYRADWPGAVETTIRRAERAEAELAALRDRVRGLADNADRWAARPINGNAFDATVPTDDLRRLLDDDTAGAASGEGEK